MNLFFLTAIGILEFQTKLSSFPVLFGKIASAYFI